jgi:transposase
MQIAIDKLPTETESLHKLVVSLESKNQELLKESNNWLSKYEKLSEQNSELTRKNTELSERINNLEEQLKLLKAKRFGKSSEKLERQIDIVERLLEEEESLLGFVRNNINSEGELKKEKVKARRKKLPEHLPREDVILKPETKCGSCGGEEFRTISEDVSEVLEHIPESFKIYKTKMCLY